MNKNKKVRMDIPISYKVDCKMINIIRDRKDFSE